MKILCVYLGRDAPSSRIRILQMGPFLTERGLDCEMTPYPRKFRELAALLPAGRKCDLIWLQKKLPNYLDRLLLRRIPRPLVFDYDDAICFRKDPKRGSYHSRTRAGRFAGITSQASGITCGNRYLASLLQPGRHKVLPYPSPVPTAVPQRDYDGASGPFRLVWIGEGNNLDSLRRIAPQLRSLSRKVPIVLHVISDREFDWEGIAVRNTPWSLTSQETLLAEADVGLMPLDRRSPYDRGKCSYKILQYTASGLVPVADAVGMNPEIIADGQNGRLVHGEADWEKVLSELLSQGRPGLAEMSREGRKAVMEKYNYPVWADRLAAFFEEVAASSGTE